jgi:uncharacterized protein (DUF488 family)
LEVRKAYSIGFTKKSAEGFFGTLKNAGIQQLIDIRLNNVSQLAGFTKQEDLKYFLKTICGITYRHELSLAPTKEILDAYKKQKGNWANYEVSFLDLMTSRKVENLIPRSMFNLPTVLLCSEPTPEKCHRRLVLEYLKSKWGDIEIIHLK